MIEAQENINLYRSIVSLYEKFISSNSINQNNFQKIFEKIFAHIEFILQKILIGINTIDFSNNEDKFILW